MATDIPDRDIALVRNATNDEMVDAGSKALRHARPNVVHGGRIGQARNMLDDLRMQECLTRTVHVHLLSCEALGLSPPVH